MNTAQDQIWNLIQSSSLLTAEQIAAMRSVYESPGDDGVSDSGNVLDGPGQLLDWLTDKGILSPFHKEVIGAGSHGPFVYGDYLLLDRNTSRANGECSTYTARHLPTGHGVQLKFLGGDEEHDIDRWRELTEWINRRQAVRSANIPTIHQAVVLPSYRFIVSESPPGECLLDRIPVKSRLPWKKSCKIIGYLAEALVAIHEKELWHGNLWPGNVQILSNGGAVLMWDFDGDSAIQDDDSLEELPMHYQSDNALNQHADWYGLGCVLYRLLSGKTPGWQESDKKRIEYLNRLVKYEVPKPIIKLCHYLTTTVRDESIDPDHVFDVLKQELKRDTFAVPAKLLPETYPSMVQHVQKTIQPGELPELLINGKSNESQVADTMPRFVTDETNDAKPRSVTSTPKRRKKNLLYLGIACATSIAGLGVVALLLFLSSRSGDPGNTSVSSANQNSNAENSSTDEDSNNNSDENNAEDVDVRVPSGWLNQKLVDDNDELLWESPTNGFAMDWSGVPSAPDFVLTIRGSDLLVHEAALSILRSLGPDVQQLVSDWETQTGFKLSEIQQLIVSLHSRGGAQFESFFVVRLNNKLSSDVFANRFKSAAQKIEPGDGQYFQSEPYCYYVPTAPDIDSNTFYVSSPDFLNAVISQGQSQFGGSMRRLADQVDSARHVNLFFNPKILSNEQSQALFKGNLEKMRRPLMFFFDERVNGVLLSFHMEDDFYWEMRLDRSPDIEPTELKRSIDEQFRETRDTLVSYVTSLSDSPYWSRVKQRFDNMINYVYRYSRVAVENGETVANGWLPASAAHNLLAATELSLSAAPGMDSVVIVEKSPQTLQELLDKKRNLTITSSPDLVNLLRDLQSEIQDDYPNLPFDFEIRLMGSDLSEEGITQNQRPGDITMPDNSLAEILTEICFQANPEKNAKSPRDELCKLVWVIADNPDQPGNKIVLITTRKAVSANGYDLPKAFQPE